MFYVLVQNIVPSDIINLTLQVTRGCDQNKEHLRMITDLASILGLKKRDSSGMWVSVNTTNEVIPRKPKGNGKQGSTHTAAGSYKQYHMPWQ